MVKSSKNAARVPIISPSERIAVSCIFKICSLLVLRGGNALVTASQITDGEITAAAHAVPSAGAPAHIQGCGCP